MTSDHLAETTHVEMTALREQLKEALEGWHKETEAHEKTQAELTQLQALRDKAADGKVACEDCGSILARWV